MRFLERLLRLLWRYLFAETGQRPSAEAQEQMPLPKTPYARELEEFMDTCFPGRRVSVWHEKHSEYFHLDLYIMEPTEDEPYYVLYTSGMSTHPMPLDDLEYPLQERYLEMRRAELMMYLPATWRMVPPGQTEPQAQAGQENEQQWYWPIRVLKALARFPQKYQTWLGAGHSIPNGEPMQEFEGAQGFTGVVLYFPDEGNGPKRVLPMPTADGEQVMLYVAVPVYPEEMELKLAVGAYELEELLRTLPDAQGFIITNGRPNTAKGDQE